MSSFSERRKGNGNPNFKHGDCINGKASRLYIIRNDMIQRCLSPNKANYKHYGGRGIKICYEWANSYPVFKKWALTNGYADSLTIDRIDNDGDYEPSNCRWISKIENLKRPKTKRR